MHQNDPTGYGRIVREAGLVQRIVEQKDANEQEMQITEVNTGILCVPNCHLHQWLPSLKNNNAQGEYYLTDIIALAVQQDLTVHTYQPQAAWEVEGINDKLQLATLERVYQRLQAEQLMRAGATIIDPARFDMRGTATIGMDVFFDVNVVLEGQNQFGNGVKIGANSIIKNCRIADGVEIRANSVLEDAEIGQNAQIGPFARIRPQSKIGANVHIGNFVETKNIIIVDKIVNLLYPEHKETPWSFIEHMERIGQDVRYSIDDSKLRALGWSPTADFDTELVDIVQYYKHNFIW